MKKVVFAMLACSIFIIEQTKAQNILLGPANGVGIIRAISPNGKYVVGQQNAAAGVAQGFIWDSETGNTVTYFGTPSEAFGVTDDKFVVGVFDDPDYTYEESPIRSGGYWEEGTGWTGLGLGLVPLPPPNLICGSNVKSVTSDGNIIAGFSQDYSGGSSSSTVKPYSWTKNGDSWDETTWGHPENLEQGAAIVDVSADGSKAVGWVRVEGSGQRQGILWTSQSTYEILFEEENEYSEYTCISPNGKYAGFRITGQTGIYDLENDTIYMIPEGFLTNAISNAGLSVGAYKSPAGVDKGFVWSKELGFMDFGEFASLFAPGLISSTTPLGMALNVNHSNVYSLMDITPDGLSIAIQLTAPRVYQAYIFKLENPIVVLPYPKNLTASIVIPDRDNVALTWEAPQLDDETLTGYIIYRNGDEVETVDENTITYIDENAPTGYHNYTVKADYGGEQSRSSNIAQVIVVDTYELPFHDDFESKSLQTNFWTTEKITGTINSPEWGSEMEYSGIEASYGADFHSNGQSGEYESSLISKYLNGTNATNIYLSYMLKPVYTLDTETTPDTVFVEVYDGNEWTTVDRSHFRLAMEWKAEIFDLSEVAAGNYFKIRFRITGANYSINTKYVYFDDITVSTTLPEGTAIVHDIISKKSGENLQLAWQSPETEFYSLTYANTPKRYSIGDAGANFIAVNYFTSEDLSIYKDLYLTSITVYMNQKVASPSVATKIKLAVFDGETRIVNQDISSFTANAWNTFELNQPILLNDKNLKFGIEVVTHDVSEEPIGVDGNRNPIEGKGDLYSEDGGLTWKTLTDANTVNNWCIIGNVSTENYEGEWNTNILGYNIYKEGVRLNEDIVFAQSFTDDNFNADACYTIRAYSLIDGISAESDEICIIDETSINQPNKENNIIIYPNPANNHIYIKENYINLTVYDIQGKELFKTNKKEIPVNDLQNGIYLFKIKTENGISTQKVIISR